MRSLSEIKAINEKSKDYRPLTLKTVKDENWQKKAGEAIARRLKYNGRTAKG